MLLNSDIFSLSCDAKFLVIMRMNLKFAEFYRKSLRIALNSINIINIVAVHLNGKRNNYFLSTPANSAALFSDQRFGI